MRQRILYYIEKRERQCVLSVMDLPCLEKAAKEKNSPFLVCRKWQAMKDGKTEKDKEKNKVLKMEKFSMIKIIVQSGEGIKCGVRMYT